jgi:sulfur carrier protein
MIEVMVNGSAQRFEAPIHVSALLERLSMAGKKVAVERNGEIVPKSAHASTLIAHGDQLEIVVAVGGG